MAPSTRTVIALALLLVVAGCSGGGSQQTGGDASVEQGLQSSGDGAAATATAAAEATGAEADGAAGVSEGSVEDVKASLQNRKLIRTAEVRVRVENFDSARDRLVTFTREQGGFVGDSRRQVRGERNRTWTEGTLTLRIPVENYSVALSAVNDTGEVLESSQQTRDVTDRIVDLEARLENLKAERDRLRTLFEEANDTEAVLQVQNRLSDVQGDIERIQAQLRQLRRKVAFTTITVRLVEERPPAPPEPDDPEWYDTPVVTAFLESVGGVITFLRASVVLAAFALPYLLVIGVPLAGLLVGVRRVRGDRRGGNDHQVPSVRSGDADDRDADGSTDHEDEDPDDE